MAVDVIIEETAVEIQLITQVIDVVLHDPDPIDVVLEEGLEGRPGQGAPDPGDLAFVLQLAAL